MHDQAARMEFHVSRQARDRYKFNQALFSLSGNVIFANFHAARLFSQKINERRDVVNYPEQAVRAGQINAMGLIDEILHYVAGLYSEQRVPNAMGKALAHLYDQLGEETVDATLREFTAEFPPVAVYNREISAEQYLEGDSTLPGGESVSNRAIALEEMLLLWLANVNPAFSPFMELFDDSALERNSAYAQVIANLQDFFEDQPTFGPDDETLVEMLRGPARNSPHSLSGQLEYIRTRWAPLLGRYLYRLLSSLDFIREEEKAIFLGPGPARVYEFAGLEREDERFSPDKDWMPKVVLLAKNVYVWLDQLSKKYKRSITRLDEIPDEELDTLSRWGFTGLWLIGLWQRSEASKRIKQLRGNLDAVASAYSLLDYQIAGDIGGYEAYQNLRDRAWKRGIRLSSDMVPNHMGIDSRWVIEHPDWFIQLNYPPFPSYTFNGPNLSWDDRVGIYLEDHYFDNTDAAVVFKRVDQWSGDTRYIYHGNDGTSMPWNDTAQLNYLIPEVREAVIQTILHVARMFPIIRFDAAMTLAKRHYQRLWFPEPGSGGDIPSRAEHGMTKEQFDAAFPKEFWREVVDRVAEEVPDTLLLAEAFWMMEGYFVRTLGMHRVYNSAFMNMLRDEKNQEYRLVIKNTVEFDLEILKRYVNFMNNPDERTAVDQFGSGDKYFGICTMMVTMPGLPMFGHGQVQGYAEKYGMEFRRAYWDEQPNPYLVDRHEREIFPLMHKRYIFADVENFLLYDFFTTDGHVNEDVFAYSNRAGGARGLVLYHNKFASTKGWIRTSAAYSEKTGQGEDRRLVQRTLGEGLGLSNDPNMYVIFRDQNLGLEYIRKCQEIHDKGFYAELEAYTTLVFLDFREVQDNEWRQYAQLATFLDGRGVPDIDEALKEIFLQPIHEPFRELVNPGSFRWLIDNRWEPEGKAPATAAQATGEAALKAGTIVREIKAFTGGPSDVEDIVAGIRDDFEALLSLPALQERFPKAGSRKYRSALKFLLQHPAADGEPSLESGDAATWGALLGWAAIRRLGRIASGEDEYEAALQSRTWIDEWLFGKIIATTLQDMGVDEDRAWQMVAMIKLMTTHQGWCSQVQAGKKKQRAYRTLQSWLQDSEIQQFIGVNRYQDILWFSKEAFDELLWWMLAGAAVEAVGEHATDGGGEAEAVADAILACYDVVRSLQKAEQASDYQVEKLLEAAR